ncbi:uncharacterized protein C2845_PM01G25760 [Panicum miliaceum]|uniref:MATH domain-containing protein n=1 Tax=Panicum miliaceum TaxID=4540 RepID=A0A3L6TP04_PANMI|nr:uncharacterized protein C2845_PM01G25760 [Panicum miliaceum]
MSSSTAAGPSRIVPVPVAAYHVLKIDGHPRTLGTQRAGLRRLESCPFRAREHTWRVNYYPMGTGPATADYIAVFLVLVDSGAGEEDVLARVTFSLLDQDQKPVPSCSLTTAAYNFSKLGSIGYPKFVRREELDRSGLVKDDCFALRSMKRQNMLAGGIKATAKSASSRLAM